MRLGDVRGIARAQALAREVIHEAAQPLRPGDREVDVAERINARLEAAGVRGWLHTAYAWWGERTRFSGFDHWEPDALPGHRRLQEGEPYVLDVAPLVEGFPADYALSGITGGGTPEQAAEHAALLKHLAEAKAALVTWVREHASGASLYTHVRRWLSERGADAVHEQYPAGVLAHALGHVPWFLRKPRRIGSGFQLPLWGGYGLALAGHHLFGSPYPFINGRARERPVGLFAVEPHVGRGATGAKFESVLLVDGDETRWLDPGLFGEVSG